MAGEWVSTTLGQVVELKRGYDLPTSQREPGEVPIVSSSGISGAHSVAKVRGPGVVTGRYGTIGQVHYIKEDFWPLNTTLYVRDFKGSDPRFVAYYLRTLDFWSYSDKAAVPGVNRNDLHLANVRWPPLNEQRAISEILGALDDKILLNKRIAETLEGIASALFNSWFVEFDTISRKSGDAAIKPSEDAGRLSSGGPAGDGNSGWPIAPLDEQVDILGGGTPKTTEPEYWGGEIPWFSVVDAPSGADTFVFGTERYITPKGLENSAASILPEGVTIITARGTVGKIALAGVPMTINQSCYAVRSKNNSPYYTYFLIKSALQQLKSNTHGSVFDTITRQTFSATLAVIPPRDLVARYEEAVSPILERLKVAVKESESLSAMRDALLPRLISGELSIRSSDMHEAVA